MNKKKHLQHQVHGCFFGFILFIKSVFVYIHPLKITVLEAIVILIARVVASLGNSFGQQSPIAKKTKSINY